jgi:predicted nucleic acid-binding protein
MIVDSSVLIHLSRIGRLSLLKNFFETVIITEDVFRETVVEAKGKVGVSAIEQAIGKWISVQKLKDKKAPKKIAGLEGITPADASLIVLAEEAKDSLLSNDYVLICVARARHVEAWWLTTFILNLVAKKTISKKKGKQVLLELMETGLRLSPSVYASVLDKIDRM